MEYDNNLEEELNRFRRDLIKFDIDTGHRHKRDVEELLFKIKNRTLPYIQDIMQEY